MGEQDISQQKFWYDMINKQFDDAAGDESDRWTYLLNNFRMTEELDIMEEYDGMNNENAKFLVMMVSLPLLVRGHAVQTRVMDDILSIRVPNLYRVTLGLPCSVLENSTSNFFDCKLRKMFLVMPVRTVEEVVEIIEEKKPVVAPPPKITQLPEPKKDKRPLIEDITPVSEQETSNTDDLLFDVV